MKILKILTFFLSIVSGLITPILPAMLSLGVLVFADLVTGIWKAKKIGEPITSKKMAGTIKKLTIYFLLLICAHQIDLTVFGMFPKLQRVMQLCAGFISMREFKSLAENAGEILGMPLWQYLREKLNIKNDNPTP
jgi:phage-related holin